MNLNSIEGLNNEQIQELYDNIIDNPEDFLAWRMYYGYCRCSNGIKQWWANDGCCCARMGTNSQICSNNGVNACNSNFGDICVMNGCQYVEYTGIYTTGSYCATP